MILKNSKIVKQNFFLYAFKYNFFTQFNERINLLFFLNSINPTLITSPSEERRIPHGVKYDFFFIINLNLICTCD